MAIVSMYYTVIDAKKEMQHINAIKSIKKGVRIVHSL